MGAVRWRKRCRFILAGRGDDICVEDQLLLLFIYSFLRPQLHSYNLTYINCLTARNLFYYNKDVETIQWSFLIVYKNFSSCIILEIFSASESVAATVRNTWRTTLQKGKNMCRALSRLTLGQSIQLYQSEIECRRGRRNMKLNATAIEFIIIIKAEKNCTC